MRLARLQLYCFALPEYFLFAPLACSRSIRDLPYCQVARRHPAAFFVQVLAIISGFVDRTLLSCGSKLPHFLTCLATTSRLTARQPPPIVTMPPKKTRAPPSSSQPVEPKPTRASGRKRRHSDASNASEQSSASAPAAVAAKRQKKSRKAEEIIVEEDAEDDLTGVATTADENVEHESLGETVGLAPSQSRHVHFGSATNGDVEDISTATHVTPHPTKMMSLIKRRTTESPGASRRYSTTIRSSLPPQWSQDDAAAAKAGPQSQEFNFAPLNEVLETRIRQRKSNGSSHGQVEFDMDDDMLVLEKEPEIAFAQQLTTPQRSHFSIRSLLGWSTNGRAETPVTDTKAFVREVATTSERVSLGASAQFEWDMERRKLQDAIVALSRDANEAKTKLQVLEMELQGLGFGGEGTDCHIIIESIREAFMRVRTSLEEQLVDTVPEDASYQDVLEIVIANVHEFAKRLRTQSAEIEQKTELIADLSTQIQGLINRLADAKIRDAELDEVNRELDQDLDTRNITIVDLEEQITVLTEERDGLRNELSMKQEEAENLGEDHADALKSVEKLQTSLEHYRTEERKLTVMITTIEKNHNELVASMNKEREETVRTLEDRLDDEMTLRSEFEQESSTRQTTITRLEIEISTLEQQYEDLQTQLNTIKAQHDGERTLRVTAENGLQEKTEETQDLEERVDQLEEQLAAVNGQLTELRSTSEAQRKQLEITETDLDDRNVEIEEINEKLQIQGKAANELRGKLFEVQQQHQKEVKELNKLMSDRDEEFQSDMTQEVARREDADALVQERTATIVTLETQLEEVEIEMQGLLKERDARIVFLEGEVKEKISTIDVLRKDIRSHETLLAAQKSQYKKDKEELEASVILLQRTIITHETTIQQLEQSELNNTSLHDSEMEDRNTIIAELHANITSIKLQITELEAEKAGLERRVEQEAEQMLELQNEKFDEIEALKATILDKQQKIQVVETKAIEADRRWEEVLTARDSEIEELRMEMSTTTTTTSEAMTMMQGAFSTLLHKFKEHIRRSANVNAELRAKINAVRDIAEIEEDALLGEGEAVIEEVEAMDVIGKMQAFKSVSTTTTTSASAQRSSHAHSSSQASAMHSSAKKGRGRKKRLQDSGISMEAEEESAL
nr:hypothetical protein CFP56_71921 [Quercus suber]